MKVLIACEYSGIVREAFKAKGHDAWSCDILPTEIPGQHIQGDCLKILNDGWDLMIGHPPCTYLSYAGIGHWHRPGREKLRDAGMKFFLDLWEAPIKKICLENPKGLPMVALRRPNQIINPCDFGESHLKMTCLWLKGLPPLFLTGMMEKPRPIYIDKKGKKRYFTDSISGFKKDAQKQRSKTFQGIANAMAEQWG